MNKIIAAFAIAITLTTTVTAYAQNAPAALWYVMCPPLGCADNAAVTGDKNIIVKFKVVELAREVKQWIAR